MLSAREEVLLANKMAGGKKGKKTSKKGKKKDLATGWDNPFL